MTISTPSDRHHTSRVPLPERLSLEDLEQLTLKGGSHLTRDPVALCVMEAAAWFAGRSHTDGPPCISKVIASFLRSWNDAMDDADRQMLKPLIPSLINTVGSDVVEMQRSWMALDWHCRISAPGWLRLAGLAAEADAIEATAPIIDDASAKAAQKSLIAARSAAYAARVAAWVAAGEAAWVAAREAARVAAVTAAGTAARAAARAAARVAAGAAGEVKLRPTVVILQASALDLVKRMIALSSVEATP